VGPERLPTFCGLIGQSPAMRVVFERIERVAPFDVPVLILGESGTGKELVAAAIHQLSGRRTARFEAVNCGGLTRELLRSELFGHERGAFTGAVDRHPGLLTAAHGGTVFLDEVGDLTPEAQVMLLRFLAEGEVRPVGATRASRADVRVIAATHRDLARSIREGRFREDLFYRLRRVVLTVPPLRTRHEDLPLLVEHFRRRLNARHRLVIEGLTPGALRRLATHGWPGNVRELDAVLEEVMILKGRGWLRAEDLTLEEPAEDRPASTDPTQGAEATRRLGRRQRVALELARAHGAVTRSQLAAACGISGELARRELQALVSLELLRRVGKGRGTRYDQV
jgi:two-component system response regulator AtoC